MLFRILGVPCAVQSRPARRLCFRDARARAGIRLTRLRAGGWGGWAISRKLLWKIRNSKRARKLFPNDAQARPPAVCYSPREPPSPDANKFTCAREVQSSNNSAGLLSLVIALVYRCKFARITVYANLGPLRARPQLLGATPRARASFAVYMAATTLSS